MGGERKPLPPQVSVQSTSWEPGRMKARIRSKKGGESGRKGRCQKCPNNVTPPEVCRGKKKKAPGLRGFGRSKDKTF